MRAHGQNKCSKCFNCGFVLIKAHRVAVCLWKRLRRNVVSFNCTKQGMGNISISTRPGASRDNPKDERQNCNNNNASTQLELWSLMRGHSSENYTSI